MALFWPCPRRTLQHYAFRDDDLRPSKTRGIQIHCLAGHRSRRLVHNSEGRNNVRELHARMRLLGDSTIIECAREDTTPPRANFPVDSLDDKDSVGKKKKKIAELYTRLWKIISTRFFQSHLFRFVWPPRHVPSKGMFWTKSAPKFVSGRVRCLKPYLTVSVLRYLVAATF